MASLADRLVFRVLMIMTAVHFPHFAKFDIGYCFDRVQFSYVLQGL